MKNDYKWLKFDDMGFGTPVLVYNKNVIEEHCKIYREALSTHYPSGVIYYASKAFSCKEMCRIAKNQGLGLDTVSCGELATALAVGFPPEMICYHGNIKTDKDLNTVISADVGIIVADSFEEFHQIDRIAKELGKKPNVLLRVNPSVEVDTHHHISTGVLDSKFGVPLDSDLRSLFNLQNLNFCGLHSHIGSQINDITPFLEAAKEVLAVFNQHEQFTHLNLGGGFGTRYTLADNPIDVSDAIAQICETVRQHAKKLPILAFEPGRSIVANACYTLYRIQGIKNVEGVRKYVIVDGGMTDNPRHIMYEAKYMAMTNSTSEELETVTIAGRCCESGDIIIPEIDLPVLKIGDYIAVLSTGAYNYSMASNYNRLPRPPVVMLDEGTPHLAIRGETEQDIMRLDI